MTNEIGARLREMRKQAKLSQADVGAVLDVDSAQISRAESGYRKLSGFELGLIAQAFGWDVRELLGVPRPAARMAVAARLRSDAARIGTALIRAADLVEVDTILDDAGASERSPGVTIVEPTAAPTSDDQAVAEGRHLAQLVRAKLEVEGPIVDLVGFAEEALGVDVVICPLDDGCDGVLAVAEHLGFAVISSEVMSGRQRFTLAHELGHAVAADVVDGVHIDGAAIETNPFVEVRANAFAAELLMPADEARRILGKRPGATELVDAMVHFGVSWAALRRRCDSVGVPVDEALAALDGEEIFDRAGRRADAGRLSEPMPARMPARLVRRARAGYADALVGGRIVGLALGVDGDELEDQLASIETNFMVSAPVNAI